MACNECTYTKQTVVDLFAKGSIPGPDVLRHGQEARDMPARVYYNRIFSTRSKVKLALGLGGEQCG